MNETVIGQGADLADTAGHAEQSRDTAQAEQPVFTADWFDRGSRPVWDQLIPYLEVRRALEIGSYEGASACYLIRTLGQKAALEIHCIDSWQGGIEHQAAGCDMQTVEANFHRNSRIAIESCPHPVELVVHKGYSDNCLVALLNDKKKGYFDFVYIDGSHQAPDVLSDAVLCFHLLRPHGVMVFDDYLWHEGSADGKDPLRCPKMAIDAFINCNFRKLRIISAPLYQIYLQKISD
jgi:predicted O-methyltransferase YrrM